MEKAKTSILLICPDHEMPIGMIDTDPSAKKIGYCYECLDESDGTVNVKSIASYQKECASFFETCRQKARISEPPANYLEELNKKGERLVKLSHHIDSEKEKVKKSFEEMKKKIAQIIDQKEKEYLESLDKEVPNLSELYDKFENLLWTDGLKPSDINAMYPELDALKQKMSKIKTIDELQAFIVGFQEDVERAKAENIENTTFAKKEELDYLFNRLNTVESSFPRAQSKFLSSDSATYFMKNFKTIYFESIVNEEFEALKDWIPQSFNPNSFKLLYKASIDGMSPQAFHQKCDGRGATITMVRCQFNGIEEPQVLGAFLDQSFNSEKSWITSTEAFLFSLYSPRKSVKCPISREKAAYLGTSDWGLKFGEDLQVEKTFKTGRLGHWAYANANLLSPTGKVENFLVDDVEVYQILTNTSK